jgi:hypothetical protein
LGLGGIVHVRGIKGHCRLHLSGGRITTGIICGLPTSLSTVCQNLHRHGDYRRATRN